MTLLLPHSSWFRLGCLSLAASVTLGAFGAHGLKSKLQKSFPEKEVNYYLDVWQKASLYHTTHSIGILLASSVVPSRCLVPCVLFSSGLLLFSGSLYGLVLSKEKKFGAIAPIGGLSFIAGWIALAMLV